MTLWPPVVGCTLSAKNQVVASAPVVNVLSGDPAVLLQNSEDPSVTAPRVSAQLEKRIWHIANVPTSPVTLGSIYVLEQGEHPGIEPLSAPESFIALVRHTFVAHLLDATDTTQKHFQQCSILVNQVPVHRLRRGAAEALELIVHGDEKSSRIVGKPIDQVEMPRGATIGAVVRGSRERPQVLMAHHDVVIQSEDHLIVFVENKRIIPRVEKLFSVGLGFF